MTWHDRVGLACELVHHLTSRCSYSHCCCPVTSSSSYATVNHACLHIYNIASIQWQARVVSAGELPTRSPWKHAGCVFPTTAGPPTSRGCWKMLLAFTSLPPRHTNIFSFPLAPLLCGAVPVSLPTV